MSMIGFKAQNHPQQTGKRGAKEKVDDRGTKWEFIRAQEARFGTFTLDVAASAHNAKAPAFYTRDDNGLERPWSGRVWCNPPYSDCAAWVHKAWEEWTTTTRPEVIVMLLPANRTEQGWWQDMVEPYRDRAGSELRVEFLRSRMRFDWPPGWTPPPGGDRPPFGICLLIWHNPSTPKPLIKIRTMCDCGHRADSHDRALRWGCSQCPCPVRRPGLDRIVTCANRDPHDWHLWRSKHTEWSCPGRAQSESADVALPPGSPNQPTATESDG